MLPDTPAIQNGCVTSACPAAVALVPQCSQGDCTQLWKRLRSDHSLRVQIDYFSTWTRLFNADALAKFGAAAVSVAAMWLTLNFAKHRLAFPAVLLSIPAIFHIVRLACGVSLQEAADAFWCAQPEVRHSWQIDADITLPISSCAFLRSFSLL